MKKILLITIPLIIIICLFLVFKPAPFVKKPSSALSRVCGNFCTEDSSTETVRIYEGVDDNYTCEKIGGIPRTYLASAPNHYCEVKWSYYISRIKKAFSR